MYLPIFLFECDLEGGFDFSTYPVCFDGSEMCKIISMLFLELGNAVLMCVDCLFSRRLVWGFEGLEESTVLFACHGSGHEGIGVFV